MNKQTAFLRQSLRAAHGFIRELHSRAKDYGSDFSGEVTVDCENFFRDNPPPSDATHIVVSRVYFERLRKHTGAALRAKMQGGAKS